MKNHFFSSGLILAAILLVSPVFGQWTSTKVGADGLSFPRRATAFLTVNDVQTYIARVMDGDKYYFVTLHPGQQVLSLPQNRRITQGSLVDVYTGTLAWAQVSGNALPSNAMLAGTMMKTTQYYVIKGMVNARTMLGWAVRTGTSVKGYLFDGRSEYPVDKYEVLTSATETQNVQQAEPTTRTLQISLRGIAMQECGSDRDCSHEPIAGWFKMNMVDSRGGRPACQGCTPDNTVWRSAGYSLRCSPMPMGSNPGGYGDQLNFTPSLPANVRSQAFVYTISQEELNRDGYTVYFQTNLGNQHKDNDFASVGHHWIASDGNPIQVTRKLSALTRGQQEQEHVLGPFQTKSDRCHEYYIVVGVVIQ